MANIRPGADANGANPLPEGHVPAPRGQEHKAAAKDDARRNEEAMERNHRGGDRYAVTLSSTISVNRAGRDRDRKSVVEGKRVDLGGRRIIKKKKKKINIVIDSNLEL